MNSRKATFQDRSVFVFDFYICKDTISTEDCENWFTHEQIAGSAFLFHAESAPYPAEVHYWDFGDGQTGTGQEIQHTYNALPGDTFFVQLTSIVFESIAGDSCFATSGQWINIEILPAMRSGILFPD